MPEYTTVEFLTRVRNKYNAYYDMDDTELLEKILAKYPVYKDQITDYVSPEDKYRDEQLTEFVKQRFDGLTDAGEGLINPWDNNLKSPMSPDYDFATDSPMAIDIQKDFQANRERYDDVVKMFRELDPDASVEYAEGGVGGVINMPGISGLDEEEDPEIFSAAYGLIQGTGKTLAMGNWEEGETPWNIQEFSLDPAIRKKQLAGFKKRYEMLPDKITQINKQKLIDLQAMQPDDRVEAIENGRSFPVDDINTGYPSSLYASANDTRNITGVGVDAYREGTLRGATDKNLYGKFDVNTLTDATDYTFKGNEQVIENFYDEYGEPFSAPGASNTKALFSGFSYRDFLDNPEQFKQWLYKAQSGKLRDFAIERLEKNNPTDEMISYANKKYGVTSKEDIISRIANDSTSPWAEYFFPIETYEKTHKMGKDENPLLANGKENPNYNKNIYYINAPAKGIPWKEWNGLSNEEKDRRVSKGEGNITQIAEVRDPDLKFFAEWDVLETIDDGDGSDRFVEVKKILAGGPANLGEYETLAQFFAGKYDQNGKSLDFIDFDRPNWEKFTNRLDASTDWQTLFQFAVGGPAQYDHYDKKIATNNLEDWWLSIKDNPTVQKYTQRSLGTFSENEKDERIAKFGWDKKTKKDIKQEEKILKEKFKKEGDYLGEWRKYREKELPYWKELSETKKDGGLKLRVEDDKIDMHRPGVEERMLKMRFDENVWAPKEKQYIEDNYAKLLADDPEAIMPNRIDNKVRTHITEQGNSLMSIFRKNEVAGLPDMFDSQGDFAGDIGEVSEKADDKTSRDKQATYTGPGSQYQLGLEYIEANNISDRESMYEARDGLFWKLNSLAKMISDKAGEVGSMRYKGTVSNVVGKLGTMFQDSMQEGDNELQLLSWTGDIARINHLVETGEFEGFWRLLRSNHPLAQEFNETLRDFQALHEVATLGKDVFGTSREFDESGGVIANIGSTWDKMFTGYDAFDGITGGAAEIGNDERALIMSNYLAGNGYSDLSPHIQERLEAGWGEVGVETTASLVPLIIEIAAVEAGGGAAAIESIGLWANRLKNYSAVSRRSKLWNGIITNTLGGTRYYGTTRAMRSGTNLTGEMLKIAAADELGNYIYGRDKMGLTFGGSMGYGMAMAESLMTSQLGRKLPFLPGILQKLSQSRAIPSRFLSQQGGQITGAGLGYMSMQVAEAAQGLTNELLGGEEYDLAHQLQGMSDMNQTVGVLTSLYFLGFKGSKVYDALSKDIHYGFKGPYPELTKAKKELNIKGDDGLYYETKEGKYETIDDLYDSEVDKLLNDKKYENDLTPEGYIKPKSPLAKKLNELKNAKRTVESYEDLALAKELVKGDFKKGSNYQKYKDNLYFLKQDIEQGAGLSTDLISWVGSGHVTPEALSATLGKSKAWAERFIEQQGQIMDMVSKSGVFPNNKYRKPAIELAVKVYDLQYAKESLEHKQSQSSVVNPEIKAEIAKVNEQLKEVLYGNEKRPGLSALLEGGKKNPHSLFAKTEPERLKQMETSDAVVESILEYNNSKGGQRAKLEPLSFDEMMDKYPEQALENPEGFFHTNADGSVNLVVNRERALDLNPATSLHELAHFLVDSSFKDAKGNVTPEGKKIIDSWLNSMPRQKRAVLEKRIADNYSSNKAPEQYYVEYLTSYLDAVGKGEATLPKGEFSKTIGNKLKDFFKDSPEINFDLSTVEGIENLIGLLNHATSKPGKLNITLQKLIDKKIASEKGEAPKEEAKEKSETSDEKEKEQEIEDANTPVETEKINPKKAAKAKVKEKAQKDKAKEEVKEEVKEEESPEVQDKTTVEKRSDTFKSPKELIKQLEITDSEIIKKINEKHANDSFGVDIELVEIRTDADGNKTAMVDIAGDGELTKIKLPFDKGTFSKSKGLKDINLELNKNLKEKEKLIASNKALVVAGAANNRDKINKNVNRLKEINKNINTPTRTKFETNKMGVEIVRSTEKNLLGKRIPGDVAEAYNKSIKAGDAKLKAGDLITSRNIKDVVYGAEKLLADINAPIINKAKSMYKEIPDSKITSRAQWNEMVDNFFSSKLPEDGSILYGKKKRDSKQFLFDPKQSGLGTYMTNFFVNKSKELFKKGTFEKGGDALDNLNISTDTPSLEATEASMRKNKALDLGPADTKLFEDITRKFIKDNIKKISKAQGDKQALSDIFDTDLNKYLDKNITEIISKKMPKGYKEPYKNWVEAIAPELIKLAETKIGKDGVMVGDPYVFINRGGKQFQNLFYKPRKLTAKGDVGRIKVAEGKENPAWDFLQPSEKAIVDFFTTDKPGKPRKDSLRKPLARIISKTIAKDYTNKVLSEAWEQAAKKLDIDKLISKDKKDLDYKVSKDWAKDIKDNPYAELTTDQLRSVLKDNLFSDVANAIIRSEDFIASKNKDLKTIDFENIKKNLGKRWGATPEMLDFISVSNIVDNAEIFRLEQPIAFKDWLNAAEKGLELEWHANNPQMNKYFETAIIRGMLDKAYAAREDVATFVKGIDALPDKVKWNGKDLDISGLKEYLKSPESAMYGSSNKAGEQKVNYFNETVLKKYIDHAIKFGEKLPTWLLKMSNKNSVLGTLGLGTSPTGLSSLSLKEGARRSLEGWEKAIAKAMDRGETFGDNTAAELAQQLPNTQSTTPKMMATREGKNWIPTGIEVYDTPWARKQADRALEALGKNESKAFAGLEKKLKDFYSDSQMKRLMKKDFTDLTDAEIAEVLSKGINEGNNAIRKEVYDAIQIAKEEYIAEAKTEAEALDRMEYVMRKSKENTNLVEGLDRQAVPIEAIYWPEGKKLMAETIKLEHLKVSVDQSNKVMAAVIQGEYSTKGKDISRDYVGILSQKKLLDIVDFRGKTTNTSTVARMALDLLELKNYRTITPDGKFGETYYERMIREAGADIKLTSKEIELIKSEALAGSVAEWAINRDATGRKILKTAVENAKTLEKVYDKNQSNQVFSKSKKLSIPNQIEGMKIADKALELGRERDKKVKKARVFDFDDTVARTNSKVFATKDGAKKILNAEEFAKQGEALMNDGWKMDFSDFNRVVEGKKGPLFDLMKKMKDAAGDRDMFILTARAPESAPAIKEFLDAMGIDIPLDHIKGLGNSTGAAKGEWILEKASEGYNDFYFADDATQNVKAVKEVLDQIDVKSQVQLAMSKSADLSKAFNKLIQGSSGVEWYKDFSPAKAKVLGKSKGKGKIILPAGAEDFLGLIYTTLGKGRVGENQLAWYKKNLLDPYNRGTQSLRTERTNMMADFKELKKQLDVPKDLRKTTESGFTNEQAVRAYLWAESGMDIPGLSKRDLKELTDIVKNNPKLEAFAKQLQMILKGDKYSTPKEHWLSGTITTDLIDILNTTKRDTYLKEFKDNVDIIYSKENLNKLEAIYGSKYRAALENSIARMKSGKNRTGTESKLTNDVLDYVNGSIGTIMFFNTRSALLQTISAANFINLKHNNPIRAGKAFANQKQYWKDFTELMNSDYLVDRRNGLKLNISESEIADAAATSRNKAKAAINYILEKGYLPTKFADSFAIASGGATWYRNKIIDLVKEGKTEAQAKEIAMKEFIEISEISQQSSDPSKISSQQASTAGRIFLQFVNTPMQYTRLQKRAVQDIINKRGDWKDHVGKILYYGIMQNLWFNAAQQGLFALGFGDGDIGEKEEQKIYDTANGMLDSILRGAGFGGMTISVLKNTLLDLYERSGKDRPEYQDAWQNLLQFSPAIRSKFMKLKAAGWMFDSKNRRQEMMDKGFSLDNPAYEAAAKVISATTNIPVDRLFTKYENISNAFSDETETWESIANLLGWPSWQLKTSSSDKKEAYDDPSIYDAWEQKSILKQYGLSERGIKQYKNKDMRTKKIKELQKQKRSQYFPKEEHKDLYYKSRK